MKYDKQWKCGMLLQENSELCLLQFLWKNQKKVYYILRKFQGKMKYRKGKYFYLMNSNLGFEYWQF